MDLIEETDESKKFYCAICEKTLSVEYINGVSENGGEEEHEVDTEVG